MSSRASLRPMNHTVDVLRHKAVRGQYAVHAVPHPAAGVGRVSVAEWLEARSDVEPVAYAGLPSSPWYERGRKQGPTGAGAIVSFNIAGRAEAGKRLADALELHRRGWNISMTSSVPRRRESYWCHNLRHCRDAFRRLTTGHECQRQPRLAGRQPSFRGGVPRVKTWPAGQLAAGKREEEVLR